MATTAAGRERRAPPVAAVLDRRFEAVVFDWDGTAVPDRTAEAGELRELVEALRALGLDLIVITGTHVGNVDGQLGARPDGPGRVYLCVNRGSEVFTASLKGLELLHRRGATTEEEAALGAASCSPVPTSARVPPPSSHPARTGRALLRRHPSRRGSHAGLTSRPACSMRRCR